MVTTTLTTHVAGNSTGSLHVQFDLYSSTPDSGTVEQGMGDWYIVRGGSVIHRWRGMVGGWATINDGDIVYAKYYDRDGAAGAFASYTFTLGSTWDLTYYVDPTGGSDSYDGTAPSFTSGSTGPKATWNGAYTTYTGARSSLDKARILLKCGETFTSTGLATTNWLTLGSTTGHLHVGTYSTGAKPAITVTTSGNGSTFAGGPNGAMSLTLENLAVTGAGSGTSSTFCNFNSAPVSGSTEANVCVIDCDVVGCDAVYVGGVTGSAGSYATDVDRSNYHAMVGCTVDDWGSGIAGHAFFNLSAQAYILMFGCTWNDQVNANGFTRHDKIRYSAFINNTYDRSASTFKLNVFRLGGGEETVTNDRLWRVCVSGNNFIDCNEGIEVETLNDYQYAYEDVDFLDNRFTQSTASNYPISFTGQPTASQKLTNVRVLGNHSNCDWLPLIGITVGGSTTDTGHIESLIVANNTSVVRGGTGLGGLMNISGSSTARVDAGAITLYSNFAYGTGATGIFLSDGGGAVTQSKFGASDNNHYVTNGGTANWTSGVSLASWQSSSGSTLDMSSSSSNGNVHNLTDVTFAAFDARPASGTGPQIGTGASTVFIDADGNLFVDDAGAFENGGAAPTDPTASGAPYSLNADTGTYALTGVAANLQNDHIMSANTGTYSLTGVAATLTYSGASGTATQPQTRLPIGLRLGL